MITPTISVIMAFHNNESTIEKSLKSVLNQSYKNFELLIMDDFSQDDSLNLVKKLNDNRIKLFSNNENLGLTKSLNILSNKSLGKILARQDADDISHPERFTKQILFMKKYNLDVCTTRAYRINSKKIIPHFTYYLPHREIIKYKNPFIHGTLMIKKRIFDEVGGYDENFLYAQDYKLFVDLIKLNKKIKTIRRPYYYLNTVNNISQLKKEEQKYYSDIIKKSIK